MNGKLGIGRFWTRKNVKALTIYCNDLNALEYTIWIISGKVTFSLLIFQMLGLSASSILNQILVATPIRTLYG
jgi:hypothetical protein